MIEVLAEAASLRHLAEIDADDIFTSTAWLSVIAEAYRMSFRAVRDRQAGTTLPFAVVDDLGGRRLISLPFSDYVKLPYDPLRLLDLAEAALDSLPAFSMSIRLAGPAPAPRQGSDWVIKPSAVYHRLAPAEEPALWQGLSPSFRNQVRQGQRHGVSARIDRSLAALDRFYGLHTAVRNRKFASIPQPRRFFHLIHDRFLATGHGFVLEAWHDDTIIGGCLVLRHCGTLYYKFSASLPQAGPVRANNLMLWELMRLAGADGLALDLGRSGYGAGYKGLRHFKGSLGAATYPISSLTHSPREPDAQAALRAGEFAAIVGKLSRLVALSGLDEDGNDAAAELLYRYFA
jgi:GNAT acetyltransferase-like protein